MHWLDALWLWMPRARLFEDGWGDCAAVEEAARPLLTPDEAPPLPLSWGPAASARLGTRRLGEGRSPCALAPAAVERLTVLRLSPTPGRVRARCVVPPSWNEHDFQMRLRLLAPLVRNGVELWLLEGAFFGQRRPPGQVGVGLRSVAALLAMGLCGVLELRGLVAAARAEQPALPVVLAGFSMAGQLCGQAAATLTWDVPLAVLAPSDSAAAVFIDGPLSRSVAWPALGEGGREKLRPLLTRFGLASLAAPPTRRRVVVATRADGIVPPAAFERVAAAWQVQPRWINAGHVSALMLRGAALRAAVLEVAGLSAQGSDRGSMDHPT